MKKINILKANMNHRKLIWEWRNDPISKQMSLGNHYIEWDEHCKWFKTTLAQDQIRIYIAESFRKLIGLTRFDRNSEDKETYNISIIVAPNMRRKGFGKVILVESILIFLKEVKECKNILAVIKEENLISNNLFTACGFSFTSKEKNINTLKLDTKKLSIKL
tara:strand:+ start:486 stop:971 length:486 start_codon:yes stop_codon:yes gene_type:complete